MIKMNRLITIVIFVALVFQTSIISSITQSVGYHHNLNLGFNPYLSPVFGYGLGFPYGAYNLSPSRNPLLTDYLLGHGNSLAGKLHAKTIMKKLAWHPFAANPHYGSLKNKYFLMKHPEYAYAPNGLDYGFGKHYGATMLPNNPYKSTYGDYYSMNNNLPTKIASQGQSYSEHENPSHLASNDGMYMASKASSLIKPLVKAGVFVTTAALLGKKALESPIRLNPAGMIMNGAQYYA